MKLTLKNLSDKITAVFIYLLLAELVVALFLAIDCMVDYRFYEADPGVYAQQEMFRPEPVRKIPEIAAKRNHHLFPVKPERPGPVSLAIMPVRL